MVDVGNIKPVIPSTPKRSVGKVNREGREPESDNQHKNQQSKRSNNSDDDGIKHIDEYV